MPAWTEDQFRSYHLMTLDSCQRMRKFYKSELDEINNKLTKLNEEEKASQEWLCEYGLVMGQ